jgi:LPXTG-motif cell wall-anchored protein
MRSRSFTRLAVAALAAVPLVAVLGAAPAQADQAPVTPADAAVGWLSSELDAHDGMLTISFGGPDTYPDQGLTIDAILANVAGGNEDDPAVQDAIAAVDADLNGYLTQGSPEPGDWGSKAAAKSLLLQEVLGDDLGASIDLEAALRGLMATDADAAAADPAVVQPGRYYDANLAGFGEYGNGLGQALAILALDRTLGGVPAEAVDFLLSQQCSDGSFRLYYYGYITSYDPFETVQDETCDDVAEGDTDATALALSALLTQAGEPAVDGAIDAAVDHLLAQQDVNGGFLGTGAVNTNTTGLAGAALRAAGETAAADDAAAFVASVQNDECADLGAIAYGADEFADGVDANRDQWIRASAQGALGLGLPDYSSIGTVAPVEAGLATIDCDGTPSPSKATVTASSGAVEAGGTVDLAATGFAAGETVRIDLHSTPIQLGTAVADATGAVHTTVTIPADVEPGDHTIVLTGETSGATASVAITVDAPQSAGEALPVTGSHSGATATVGLGLVVLGAGLVSLGRRRQLRVTS